MKIKTIILLCLITQVLLNNGLVQLKTSLATSDSPLLLKILQSVDAATSDEHLLEVILKLLKSLCVCMRETLKAKEDKFNIDNNSIEPNDSRATDGKVLDLYRKIYNNTCFNLRQELTNRTQKSIIDEENELLTHTHCGKDEKNQTQSILDASDKSTAMKNSIPSKLEHVLFKALIQTKDIHKYKLKRYNLFGKGKPQTKSALQHSIIVIITLHPNVQEIPLRKYNVTEEDLNRTLHTKSPIDIDIIDTKHDQQHKEKEEHLKSENFTDCNLQSLYIFLAESEKKNLTKVFKFLRKRDTIKIYIEINTGQNHTDYINICCCNGTIIPQCNKDFINDFNTQETIYFDKNKNNMTQPKFYYQNYRKTITKIKNLVKLYEDKLNDTNEMHINGSVIKHQDHNKEVKTNLSDIESTTEDGNTQIQDKDNDINKLVSNSNDPLQLGEVTRAILLLNNFVSKQTTKKVLKDHQLDKTDLNQIYFHQEATTFSSINNDTILNEDGHEDKYAPLYERNKTTITEIITQTTTSSKQDENHKSLNDVVGVTLPIHPVSHRTSKNKIQQESTLKMEMGNFVNNTFTVDIDEKDHKVITNFSSFDIQNTTKIKAIYTTVTPAFENIVKPRRLTSLLNTYKENTDNETLIPSLGLTQSDKNIFDEYFKDNGLSNTKYKNNKITVALELAPSIEKKLYSSDTNMMNLTDNMNLMTSTPNIDLNKEYSIFELNTMLDTSIYKQAKDVTTSTKLDNLSASHEVEVDISNQRFNEITSTKKLSDNLNEVGQTIRLDVSESDDPMNQAKNKIDFVGLNQEATDLNGISKSKNPIFQETFNKNLSLLNHKYVYEDVTDMNSVINKESVALSGIRVPVKELDQYISEKIRTKEIKEEVTEIPHINTIVNYSTDDITQTATYNDINSDISGDFISKKNLDGNYYINASGRTTKSDIYDQNKNGLITSLLKYVTTKEPIVITKNTFSTILIDLPDAHTSEVVSLAPIFMNVNGKIPKDFTTTVQDLRSILNVSSTKAITKSGNVSMSPSIYKRDTKDRVRVTSNITRNGDILFEVQNNQPNEVLDPQYMSPNDNIESTEFSRNSFADSVVTTEKNFIDNEHWMTDYFEKPDTQQLSKRNLTCENSKSETHADDFITDPAIPAVENVNFNKKNEIERTFRPTEEPTHSIKNATSDILEMTNLIKKITLTHQKEYEVKDIPQTRPVPKVDIAFNNSSKSVSDKQLYSLQENNSRPPRNTLQISTNDYSEITNKNIVSSKVNEETVESKLSNRTIFFVNKTSSIAVKDKLNDKIENIHRNINSLSTLMNNISKNNLNSRKEVSLTYLPKVNPKETTKKDKDMADRSIEKSTTHEYANKHNTKSFDSSLIENLHYPKNSTEDKNKTVSKKDNAYNQPNKPLTIPTSTEISTSEFLNHATSRMDTFKKNTNTDDVRNRVMSSLTNTALKNYNITQNYKINYFESSITPSINQEIQLTATDNIVLVKGTSTNSLEKENVFRENTENTLIPDFKTVTMSVLDKQISTPKSPAGEHMPLPSTISYNVEKYIQPKLKNNTNVEQTNWDKGWRMMNDEVEQTIQRTEPIMKLENLVLSVTTHSTSKTVDTMQNNTYEHLIPNIDSKQTLGNPYAKMENIQYTIAKTTDVTPNELTSNTSSVKTYFNTFKLNYISKTEDSEENKILKVKPAQKVGKKQPKKKFLPMESNVTASYTISKTSENIANKEYHSTPFELLTEESNKIVISTFNKTLSTYVIETTEIPNNITNIVLISRMTNNVTEKENIKPTKNKTKASQPKALEANKNGIQFSVLDEEVYNTSESLLFTSAIYEKNTTPNTDSHTNTSKNPVAKVTGFNKNFKSVTNQVNETGTIETNLFHKTLKDRISMNLTRKSNVNDEDLTKIAAILDKLSWKPPPLINTERPKDITQNHTTQHKIEQKQTLAANITDKDIYEELHQRNTTIINIESTTSSNNNITNTKHKSKLPGVLTEKLEMSNLKSIYIKHLKTIKESLNNTKNGNISVTEIMKNIYDMALKSKSSLKENVEFHSNAKLEEKFGINNTIDQHKIRKGVKIGKKSKMIHTKNGNIKNNLKLNKNSNETNKSSKKNKKLEKALKKLLKGKTLNKQQLRQLKKKLMKNGTRIHKLHKKNEKNEKLVHLTVGNLKETTNLNSITNQNQHPTVINYEESVITPNTSIKNVDEKIVSSENNLTHMVKMQTEKAIMAHKKFNNSALVQNARRNFDSLYNRDHLTHQIEQESSESINDYDYEESSELNPETVSLNTSAESDNIFNKSLTTNTISKVASKTAVKRFWGNFYETESNHFTNNHYTPTYDLKTKTKQITLNSSDITNTTEASNKLQNILESVDDLIDELDDVLTQDTYNTTAPYVSMNTTVLITSEGKDNNNMATIATDTDYSKNFMIEDNYEKIKETITTPFETTTAIYAVETISLSKTGFEHPVENGITSGNKALKYTIPLAPVESNTFNNSLLNLYKDATFITLPIVSSIVKITKAPSQYPTNKNIAHTSHEVTVNKYEAEPYFVQYNNIVNSSDKSLKNQTVIDKIGFNMNLNKTKTALITKPDEKILGKYVSTTENTKTPPEKAVTLHTNTMNNIFTLNHTSLELKNLTNMTSDDIKTIGKEKTVNLGNLPESKKKCGDDTYIINAITTESSSLNYPVNTSEKNILSTNQMFNIASASLPLDYNSSITIYMSVDDDSNNALDEKTIEENSIQTQGNYVNTLNIDSIKPNVTEKIITMEKDSESNHGTSLLQHKTTTVGTNNVFKTADTNLPNFVTIIYERENNTLSTPQTSSITTHMPVEVAPKYTADIEIFQKETFRNINDFAYIPSEKNHEPVITEIPGDLKKISSLLPVLQEEFATNRGYEPNLSNQYKMKKVTVDDNYNIIKTTNTELLHMSTTINRSAEKKSSTSQNLDLANVLLPNLGSNINTNLPGENVSITKEMYKEGNYIDTLNNKTHEEKLNEKLTTLPFSQTILTTDKDYVLNVENEPQYKAIISNHKNIMSKSSFPADQDEDISVLMPIPNYSTDKIDKEPCKEKNIKNHNDLKKITNKVNVLNEGIFKSKTLTVKDSNIINTASTKLPTFSNHINRSVEIKKSTQQMFDILSTSLPITQNLSISTQMLFEVYPTEYFRETNKISEKQDDSNLHEETHESKLTEEPEFSGNKSSLHQTSQEVFTAYEESPSDTAKQPETKVTSSDDKDIIKTSTMSLPSSITSINKVKAITSSTQQSAILHIFDKTLSVTQSSSITTHIADKRGSAKVPDIENDMREVLEKEFDSINTTEKKNMDKTISTIKNSIININQEKINVGKPSNFLVNTGNETHITTAASTKIPSSNILINKNKDIILNAHKMLVTLNTSLSETHSLSITTQMPVEDKRKLSNSDKETFNDYNVESFKEEITKYLSYSKKIPLLPQSLQNVSDQENTLNVAAVELPSESTSTTKTVERTLPPQSPAVLSTPLSVAHSSTMNIQMTANFTNSLNKGAFIKTTTDKENYLNLESPDSYNEQFNKSTEATNETVPGIHKDNTRLITISTTPLNLESFYDNINISEMNSFPNEIKGDNYSKPEHNKQHKTKSTETKYVLTNITNKAHNITESNKISNNNDPDFHSNNVTSNVNRSYFSIQKNDMNPPDSIATTPHQILFETQIKGSKIVKNNMKSLITDTNELPHKHSNTEMGIMMLKMKSTTMNSNTLDYDAQINKTGREKIKPIYYKQYLGPNTSNKLQYNILKNATKIKFAIRVDDGEKNISYIHTPTLSRVKVTKMKPITKTINVNSKSDNAQELVPESSHKMTLLRSRYKFPNESEEDSYNGRFKTRFTNVKNGKSHDDKSMKIFSSRLYKPSHISVTAVTKNIKYNTYQPTTKEDLELLKYDNKPIFDKLIYKKKYFKPHPQNPVVNNFQTPEHNNLQNSSLSYVENSALRNNQHQALSNVQNQALNIIQNPALNNSCAILRNLRKKFHSVTEFLSILKAANCTEDYKNIYAEHLKKDLHFTLEINKNLHPPMDMIDKPHSIEIDKISHPILEININSPQIEANRDSPPMIEINGNPLPMEINKNMQQMLEFNSNSPQMHNIIKNAPPILELNRFLPSMVDINRNAPQMVDNNRILYQMLDNNRNSPQMVDNERNSPQTVNIIRKKASMIDFNSNLPQMVNVNRNSLLIGDVNRNSPQMVNNNRNSPETVDSLLQMFEMNRNSPQMPEINRNLTQEVDNNRNSPQMVEINRNSPQLVKVSRNSPQMDDHNRISPQMVDVYRNSPQVVNSNMNSPQMADNNINLPQIDNNNRNSPETDDSLLQMFQMNRILPQMPEINRNSPQVVNHNRNSPQMVEVYRNSPQIVDNVRTSPQMVNINRNSPLMGDVNRNSPQMVHNNMNLSQLAEYNRNSPQMVNNNRNSPEMVESLLQMFEMNRNSPQKPEINRNSPQEVDNNRNSPQMVEINRNSPQLVDINRNSPQLIDVNRNSVQIADINRNLPPMFDYNRNSPQMVDINRNSPQLVDINRSTSQLFDINRNSPQMVEINRNSPQMVDDNRNSPQMVDINRNSPQMVEINRNLPQVVDINRNSPQMVDNNRNSPQMVDINRFSPQMVEINRNLPQVVDINRNSPQMDKINRNSYQLLEINRNLPPMVDINKNLLPMIDDIKRNVPLMADINRDPSPIVDSKNNQLIKAINRNIASIEINNQSSPVEVNRNLPQIIDINKQFLSTQINNNSPTIGGDVNKNSPTMVEFNRISLPITEINKKTYPIENNGDSGNSSSLMDTNSYAFPIESSRSSPPMIQSKNKNSFLPMEISRNSTPKPETNKSFPLMIENNINSPPTMENNKKSRPANELKGIMHPIIEINTMSVPMTKIIKNSKTTAFSNRNSPKLRDSKFSINKKPRPMVEMHKYTHPALEINRNLHLNIVTNNFKRTGKPKKSLLDPSEKKKTYAVKVAPGKAQKKAMKRIKLVNRRKEIMTMNTQDFFSQHRAVTLQNVLRKFTKSPSTFLKPIKSIPNYTILRPKFDNIDKATKRLEHHIRPKPMLIKPKSDVFNDDMMSYHHLKSPVNTKKLVKPVLNFQQKGVLTKKAKINNVMDRPLWHTTPKSKFMKDRIDSMRNFLYNADYVKVTSRPIFNKVLHKPAGSDTSGDNYRPSAFYHRRSNVEPTTEAVTDWWLDDMYLKVRLPLPINSNPGMVFPRRHFAKMEEVADLGALFIDDLLDYKEMLDRGELPLERATNREKGQPLCMEQFYRLLGVCRIPEVGRDRLELPVVKRGAEESEELVVVACRNYFYPIPVKAADRGRLTPGEIQAQLLHAMVDAAGAPQAPRVGLLTSMNRDQWARAREQLIKDEMNRMNLELISRALCILCLDEGGGDRADTDADTNAMLRAMHGAGTRYHSANRWFDKTVQLIISSDGTLGMCYEHSAAEGVAVVRLAERALARAEVADRPAPPPALLPAPQAMKWNLTPDVKRTIEAAARDLDRAISDLDHKVYTYRGYGREFMKSCRTSPDVYIQLAMQYAYYKMYGYLVTTYESASLRRFRNGRVDNIRSAHGAALSWAAAMCTAETSPLNDAGDDGQKKVSFNLYGEQKKLELFEEAARKQTSIMEANILGKGIDNHLLGLREAARETLGELPPVFCDNAYKQMIEFKLSTSQVATTTDGTFMGYGAVCPDGYGCSYNPKKDSVIFCISSFTSSSVTNTEAFRQSLEEALDSMKLMFQARKVEN